MAKKNVVDSLEYGDSRNAAVSSAFGDGGTHDHKLPTGVRKPGTENGTLKPMRFVSLHHHTTFSYLDGFQLPEAHVRRATEINMSAMAFTEHGNISSHVKAEHAALKAGVKPIFGCEIYMGKVGDEATQKKYHLTVLAKNQQGYRNLLKLVSASYAEGFHYEPTVSPEMLLLHRKGLIILSGCQGSLLFCSTVGGKLVDEKDASYARGKKVARWFRDRFDDYYIEVQAFPELRKTRQFNPLAERMSSELGIPLVGTMDCHYTVPDEAEIQKVLHNVRPGEKRTLEELEQQWGYNVFLCPPPTDNYIFTKLCQSGLTHKKAMEAIVNTETIAQGVSVELPKLEKLRYPLPGKYKSSDQLMRDWLRDGWLYRECNRMPWPEQERYREKLAYELDIISQKDFLDYFLLVSDGVRYAKDKGIPVGPARGSAAASLLCWLLRITEVNPMLFPNLVFERFIDISREDLPDIDLDFPAWGRPIVREYHVAKYGASSVGNIGTFTVYKAKLALDDVGKVHRVPKHSVETVKELLVERSSGDLRASATIEDTVQHFDAAAEVVDEYPALRKAMDLEGNVKTFGVHAAGLVVANGDIRDVCALYQRTVNGHEVSVVSMDKYDAERQGLLKLDYLALSTLDMLTYAIEQIGMSLDELYRIPLEDPAIIQGFRENDCTGIFQFDGRAARSINQVLKPDNFVEICDVIALCRPGPLHSGAAGDYIDTKWKRRKRESLHLALDSITSATHGQIVYQEQILRVVTEIGDFNWTHASAIRRIMSKKEGSAKFNQQWIAFRDGALKWHERNPDAGPPFTEDLAEYIWGRLITAGAYAFNFAHCVSYGMLGAWAMWIKRKHPEVFFASALAKLPPGNKIPSQHESLMRNAMEKKVKLLPPHPVHSTGTWSRVPGKKAVRAGFEQITGVGGKVSSAMLEHREAARVEEWSDYLPIRGIGPKTIEKIDAFCASDDPFGVLRLGRSIEVVKEQLNEWGLPYPTHTGSEIPYEKSRDTEVTYLGVVVQRNLRDIYESHRAKTGNELDPATVKYPELRELAVLLCFDGTELITVRVERTRYGKFKNAIWGCRPEKDLLLVRGVKPGWRTAREVYASEIWVIDPEEES